MQATAATQKEFKPSFNLLDATMIVAGSMIGSGIFLVSADMTSTVGSAGWLILLWIFTGVLTLIAALSYGELSAMFPKAGGQYVYLKEAYNPLIAFLFGWSFFAVIQTGTIAAVGVAFSKFAAYIFPALSEKHILFHLGVPISAAQITSIVLILFLTWVNTQGLKAGKFIQTLFTLTKLAALFGLILFGFLKAGSTIWSNNWSTGFVFGKLDGNLIVPYTGVAAAIGAFSGAMVGSLFSSDSWNNVTFIAGEIENPKRNIGLSLFLGTLIVTLIYTATNLMYLAVMPLQSIAGADRVGVEAAKLIFGSTGTTIIAVMLMISTFGCNNGLILSGARVYYTMAKDGLFFRQAAYLNKNAVPSKGLWIQGLWASVLCLSGKYGDLLNYIIFTVLVFYILTIAGIFILRRRRPDIPRPYKAFGYPVLPLFYILSAGVIALSLLLSDATRGTSLPGLGIVLLGIPIYYLFGRNRHVVEEAPRGGE